MLVITMITRIAGCDNAAKLISRPAYGQGDADLTANARSSSVRDILPALPLVLGRTLLPHRAGSVSGRGAGSSPAGAARGPRGAVAISPATAAQMALVPHCTGAGRISKGGCRILEENKKVQYATGRGSQGPQAGQARALTWPARKVSLPGTAGPV